MCVYVRRRKRTLFFPTETSLFSGHIDLARLDMPLETGNLSNYKLHYVTSVRLQKQGSECDQCWKSGHDHLLVVL